MTHAEFSAPDFTFDELSERIYTSRQTHKKCCPMPEQLWQAAPSLSKRLYVQQVSKALRLNYTALKNRVHPENKDICVNNQAPAALIEQDFKQKSSSILECILEMQDGSGANMRMHFLGKTDLDLLELSNAFWIKGLYYRLRRICGYWWPWNLLISEKASTAYPGYGELCCGWTRLPVICSFYATEVKPPLKFSLMTAKGSGYVIKGCPTADFNGGYRKMHQT